MLAIKALTYLNPGASPAFTYPYLNIQLQPDQLLVKVKAASLNPVDIKALKLPLLWASPGEKGLGRDFCGVVENVGAALHDRFARGDRVCGMSLHVGGPGTLASHIVLTLTNGHDSVFKPPSHLTNEEAAAIPLAFATAFQALSHATYDKHAAVCVLGGSTATGMFVIQLAKHHFGASRVVATASDQCEPLVKSVGADHVVFYKRRGVLQPDLAQAVVDATRVSNPFAKNPATATPFRCVVDCVGGTHVHSRWRECMDPATKGSAYVTLVGDGDPAMNPTGGSLSYLTHPSQLLRKVFVSGLRYYVIDVRHGPWVDHAPYLFDSFKVRVVLDSVCDWRDWKPAFEKLAAAKARGKIVLTVEDF